MSCVLLCGSEALFLFTLFILRLFFLLFLEKYNEKAPVHLLPLSYLAQQKREND